MSPLNTDFAADVAASFGRQGAMRIIQAELASVLPGRCEIVVDAHDGITQQMGFVHGGIVATVADSAGGYAAMTLRPKGIEVVTVDLNLSFVRPALGRLIATGEVTRSGRALAFCRLEVHADCSGTPYLCATGSMTVAPVNEATNR